MNNRRPFRLPWPAALATQIRLGLLAIVVVSLLVTASVLIALSFQAQLEQVHAAQIERSRSAATTIDAYLDDIQRKLNYLGRVRGLIELPQPILQQLLDGLIRHNDAYETVAIGRQDGTIVASVAPYGPLPWASLNEVPIFRQALVQQEDSIGLVESDRASGMRFVTVAIPVRNAQDKIAGALVARVNLKFLGYVVSETRVGQTGYVYVLDQRNVLIAAADGAGGMMPFDGMPIRSELRQQINAGGLSPGAYTGLRGKSVLGALSPVSTTKWNVIAELPTDEVYAPVRQLLTVMLIALVFGMLVATSVGILTTRSIVNPLRRLTAAAQQMSTGDLSARVELSTANELGLLATTFNTMSGQLQHLFGQLRDSEQRFRAVFDQTFQLMGLLTPEGMLIEVNQTALDFVDGQPDQVVGQPLWNMPWWQQNPAAQEQLRRAIAAAARGELVRYEIEIGDQRDRTTIDFSIKPLEDDAGRVVLLIAEGRDITDRKRAEQATQELVREQAIRSEAERAQRQFAFLAQAGATLAASLDYATTLQNVAQLAVPTLADYCVTDLVELRGQIQRVAVAHADPAKQMLLEQLRRYPPEQSTAEGIAQVLRSGEPMLLAEVDASFLEGAAQNADHLHVMQVLAPQSLMIVPLVVREQIIGAMTFAATQRGSRYTSGDLVIAQALAQRAALAIDNARLYNEARQAVRVRDQFLSVAAHELKTPLTTLLGNAQLLERRALHEPQIGERNARSAYVIAEQARRLNKLISALLDIGRLEQGQLEITREHVDLVALTRRIVDEWPSSQGHSITWEGPQQPILIEGDALRLEQVFQNVIQNALKYSPEGGEVHVVVAQQPHGASVAVRDQGIGIPAAALPQLFNRFYRASNVDNQQISGMGIGLFVVKEIITLHGGTVDVESTEGHGTSFTIHLPIEPNTGTLAAPASKSETALLAPAPTAEL